MSDRPKRILLAALECPSHGELCFDLELMVTDVFANAGWEVVRCQNVGDLVKVDQLLLFGLGNWGDETHRRLLFEAGALGIRRTLWQWEALPPPDLPQGLITDLLLNDAPSRTRGPRRVLESLGFDVLNRRCRSLPWNQNGTFDRRGFSLPFREARKIIKFWQDGLIDQILVGQNSRRNFLASRGIPSRFQPNNYHPIMGKPLANVTRDLDVVFLGSVKNYRSGILDRVKEEIGAKGYRLTVVDKACYGDDRTQLLNRAKILLYLRGCPWEMPAMRLIMAMGCKAMVVAEDFHDTHPFQPGEHLAMASVDDLSSTLLTYLSNEEARSKIVDNAYNFVVEALSPERCILPAITMAYDNDTWAQQ